MWVSLCPPTPATRQLLTLFLPHNGGLNPSEIMSQNNPFLTYDTLVRYSLPSRSNDAVASWYPTPETVQTNQTLSMRVYRNLDQSASRIVSFSDTLSNDIWWKSMLLSTLESHCKGLERDTSAVKCAYYSWRRPEFGSQHPCCTTRDSSV